MLKSNVPVDKSKTEINSWHSQRDDFISEVASTKLERLPLPPAEKVFEAPLNKETF